MERPVGGSLAWWLQILAHLSNLESSITVYIKLNIELLYLIGSRLYRQRFEFFFSFLVLHADSTANEDNDEDDDSSRGGSDDDRDNVVTWEQQD